MVEISTEQSMLIAVVTFMAVFALLAAGMPIALVSGNDKHRILDVPTYFEGLDIQNFAETKVVNITGQLWYDFSIGGWNIRFTDWREHSYIQAQTYASWWVFKWDFNQFKWYDKEGVEKSRIVSPYPGADIIALDYAELDNAYSKWGYNGGRWSIKNSYTQLIVYVGFNTTKYSKPSDAIKNNEAKFLFCINFDKMNTSFNAWNLIGSILFFQMPEVHPVLNAIIAIPIWIAIAYLIYILILKAIPFVG
ncbi:MAG: hypothetical protein QXG39_06580 [Candidatus Aenigmatarchaeota archaeon]